MNYSRKLACEFIGAFFLVLTVGLTCLHTPAGVIPPIAIGFSLMVMVYAGGHISGGHYNPAVTFAVATRGRMKWSDVPGYVIVQCLAGATAAGIVLWLKLGGGQIEINASSPSEPGLAEKLISELLFTFALAYVVVNVATAKAYAGNSFFGLAIGSTVMVGAFAVGPISGGSFNPAVTCGAVIMGSITKEHILPYILVELLAGVIAGLTFRALNPEDK